MGLFRTSALARAFSFAVVVALLFTTVPLGAAPALAVGGGARSSSATSSPEPENDEGLAAIAAAEQRSGSQEATPSVPELKLKENARDIESKRTAYSRTYDNGDGTYLYQSSLGRMNYYNEKAGAFEPVDPKFRQATRDGLPVFTNTADAFSVTLPSDIGAGDWVSLESTRGAVLYRPSSSTATAKKPKVASSKGAPVGDQGVEIIYRDAFGKGIDLSYLSSAEGLKENIVISAPGEATTFVFDLTAQGLEPESRDDGSIWFTSAETTVPAFVIPPPSMQDTPKHKGDEPAFSEAVRYVLEKAEGGWCLKVVADAEWLSDPERNYPVQIDPCVIYQDFGTHQGNGYTVDDCFITDAYPNTSYDVSWDSTYRCYQLKTGYYSGSGNNRTLILPDIGELESWGPLSVLTSNINLGCFHRYDGGTGPVWYGPITSDWDPSYTTWNTRPSYDPYSVANITKGGRTRFDITPIVQQWLDGSRAAYGIEFWGRDRTTSDWTKLYASESGVNYPVFECWFTTVPAEPEVRAVPEDVTVGAPTVTWQFSDAMSKTQTSVNVEIRREGGTTASSRSADCQVPSGQQGTAALPVPAEGWADGAVYEVRVQAIAFGGAVVPSPWSDWESFTYHQPSQTVPAIATTASSGWFQEQDANGDGINDVPNDGNSVGRGSVTLSWETTGAAAGYNVYLSDGNAFRLVGTTNGASWTSAGKGLFPSDSAIAALPSESSSNPYLTSAGLELRDDPRLLYSKTVGSMMDSWCAYAFKVVPYNAYGEGPIAQIPTAIVALDNRTTHVKEDPNHASYELGDLLQHDGNVYLERGSLELDVTDLSIASYGPEASLSRHYSSSSVAATSFAPGWRFFHEQTISVTGSTAVYIDQNGDAHEFRRVSTVQGGSAVGGTKYVSGSNTVHVFNSSGSLVVNGTIPNASVLVVGGGGGGFCNLSGGGGGGGVLTGSQALSGTMAVVVGAGGPANSGNGGNSSFGSYLAYGGGRGASRDYAGQVSTSGGSGGGGAGAMPSTAANRWGSPGVSGQGGWGSAGTQDYGVYSAGGGGGGASGDASVASYATGGMGGTGRLSGITGSLAYYGGGGGGSSYYNPGAGGLGGGGRGEGGGGVSTVYAAVAGTPNTGGGGGGGAPGGSGIVAIAYPTPPTVTSWIAPNGFDGVLTSVTGGFRLTMADQSVLSFDSTGKLTSVADSNGNAVTYDRSVANRLTIKAANGQAIVATLLNGKVTAATYATSGGSRSVLYCNGQGYAGGSAAGISYFPDTENEYRTVYTYATAAPAQGRLVSIASPDFEGSSTPDGVAWLFAYDSSAKLQSWQLTGTPQAFGQNAVSYSASSATITTPFGTNSSASAIYGWDRRGLLVWRTPKTGTGTGTWDYAYSPSHDCVYERTPNGHTVWRVVDGRGNILSETADSLGMTTWTYDAFNRIVTMTDTAGSTTTYAYASTGVSRDPIAERRTLGGGQETVTTYEYASPGHLLAKRTEAISSACAAVTRYEDFAPNGEPQSTTMLDIALTVDAQGAPSSSQDLTSRRGFDAFGNLVWEKNALGEWVTKQNTYDVAGHLVASEAPSGAITSYSHDRLGGIIASEVTNGIDVVNHTEQVLDPFGTVLVKTSYNGAGTNAPLAIERSFTDLAGRTILTEVCDAAGGVLSKSKTDYDAEGRALATWAAETPGSSFPAERATRTIYDVEGRATSVTEPGASTPTITHYYPSGLVRQVDDTDGSTTSYTYDAAGRQLTETKSTADGAATTTNVYDIGGRLVATADESGDDTRYTYDLLGRQLTSGLEDIPATRNVYNKAGWLLSETDADNIATTKTYDMAGRVLVSSTAGKQTLTAYDTAGRLARSTDPTGKVVEYTYDDFSRVTLERQLTALGGDIIKETKTGFDALSRVKTVTRTAGAGVVTSAHTYLGNIVAESTISYAGTTTTTQVDPGTGTESVRVAATDGIPALTRTMTYDASSREAGASLPALGATAARTFDAAGRVRAQSAAGFSAVYDYDTESGKKRAESIDLALGGATASSFAYNAESRLTTVTCSGVSDTFAYDVAGNLTGYRIAGVAGTLAYEGGQLVNMKGASGSVETTYTYDTLGRRAAAGPSTSPFAITFTYNAASQLAGYTSASASATYTYDAAGQRMSSFVTRSSVSTFTRYTYDGLTLLALAADASDGTSYTIAYLYTSDGRPYAAVYRTPESATAFSIITTDRGDVVALVGADGAIFASYRYDQWGRPLSATTQGTGAVPAPLAQAIASAQVLRYAGYAYDAESGLYYCSARYYDPATMQFITKDLAKADAEESPYQYCSGDPVGKVDPSGMWKHNTFHYSVTRSIALSLHIRRKYAEAIAAGCRMVDTRWYYNSFNMDTGYQYHFNAWGSPDWGYDQAHFMPDSTDSRRTLSAMHLAKAINLAASGDLVAACTHLGIGLHPLQDIYAHGSLAQHAVRTPDVDSTSTRTPWEIRNGLPRGWRASRAKVQTQSYLLSFSYLGRLK